jgi:thiamine transport system substrate-binding protein
MSAVPNRPRRVIALVALWALATTAAACGGDEPRGDATAPSKVVLVTYSAYELPDAAAAFTRDTGIDIEVVKADDAGAALNQVMLTAGSPAGDVFFGVDNTFLTQAQGSEAFAPYEPDGIGRLDDELRLDDS